MYFLIMSLIAINGHREGPWTVAQEQQDPPPDSMDNVAEPSELDFCLACMGHTTAQSNSCQEHWCRHSIRKYVPVQRSA